MSLTITKTSGVIFITQTGNANPKSYFGATGKYQVSDDNTTILITIGNSGQSSPDQYSVDYTVLTVGTSTASNIGTAKVLLNAIFGT